MTKACKPKKKRGHKRALFRGKLIHLNLKRKQWVRARPTVSNRFGRTVLLNKVAADVKEAHIIAALRRFGPIVRVRLFKRLRGTQEGDVKGATVQFRTGNAAGDAVKGGELSVYGVKVKPLLYSRQTETRDPRLHQDLCARRSIQDRTFWRSELLDYFKAAGMAEGPGGFAGRTQVLHTTGGQSRSTFLPDARDPGLMSYYKPTYRFSDMEAGIRKRLVSAYTSLFYNAIVKQWVTVVRLREGPEAARTLQRLLDSADTPSKRCVVLELCTSVLSVLTYRRTSARDPTGLGRHRDQPKFGEVISAVTLDGSCELVLVYMDPTTGQEVEYKIKQPAGRGYCFAGGWRHIAHHAVTELKEEGRVVLLWRFWLPGRVGLVPMFKGRDKVFMGYRRLNKDDRIEDRSDFTYKKQLKVEDAIDYSELQAAIQAASE